MLKIWCEQLLGSLVIPFTLPALTSSMLQTRTEMCDRDKRTSLIHRSRNDSRKKFYNSCPCYWTNLAQRFIFEITSKNISNGGRVIYTRVFEVHFCIAIFKSFHFIPAAINDSKRKIRAWRVFAIIALKNAWWKRSSKTHVAMTLDIWKNLVPALFHIGSQIDFNWVGGLMIFLVGGLINFHVGGLINLPVGGTLYQIGFWSLQN